MRRCYDDKMGARLKTKIKSFLFFVENFDVCAGLCFDLDLLLSVLVPVHLQQLLLLLFYCFPLFLLILVQHSISLQPIVVHPLRIHPLLHFPFLFSLLYKWS